MVLNRLSKGCKEIGKKKIVIRYFYEAIGLYVPDFFVDIAATLEHIRDQRGGMVQNRQQFEFCLMAVAEEVHAILKALPQWFDTIYFSNVIERDVWEQKWWKT